MPHTLRSLVVVAVITAQSLSVVRAQGPQPAAKPSEPQTAKPAVRPGPVRGDSRLTAPGFTIDHPKDWQQLVGGVGSAFLVLFSRARDAAVAVERLTLAVPLAPSEIIPETAEAEIKEWQDRRTLASGFSPQIVEYAGNKIVIIDFRQPGVQGLQHVRLYNIIRGTDKFRVICTTPLPIFDKYKDTFHRMALSLTPATAQ